MQNNRFIYFLPKFQKMCKNRMNHRSISDKKINFMTSVIFRAAKIKNRMLLLKYC